MSEQVKEFIAPLSEEIRTLYDELRILVMDSIVLDIKEVLWAKLPSYYVDERFVRLIPFKDHINIEARAIQHHKAELDGFKLTPKGMLQLYLGQEIPKERLQIIFRETLLG